jgi:DNA (cytosine-5)-methyltransferase 1
LNHIELFAGAGGLSLGLESAGFELLLANELSPMASETFAFNHLDIDLSSKVEPVDKVHWISSQYTRSELNKRLRENPIQATGLEETHHSDLLECSFDDNTLRRSLLVGSIKDLNKLLSEHSNFANTLKNGLGDGEVDLVSGGPPCQSFSLAGLRDHSNVRNQLPWEFAKFVGIVRPKIALLENVTGILRAFKTNGREFYAWYEVAKAFAEIEYIPLCLHVNAKFSGVAQNRPRYIMIALRRDICLSFINMSEDQNLVSLFKDSLSFVDNIDPESNLVENLKYWDIEKNSELFESGILSELKTHTSDGLISVSDAIGDLSDKPEEEREYVDIINSKLKNRYNKSLCKQANHELRRNSPRVKARFRLYQLMNKLTKSEAKVIQGYLKSEGEKECPVDVFKKLQAFWLLDTDGMKVDNPDIDTIVNIANQLFTKKQTQKALLKDRPAPAALSIPDDGCHYKETESELRTLTVREMARIQSFPDWYEIRSKVTTGGKMRKYEVPQYTQIGNAVPPLLGLALGKVCYRILRDIRCN